MPPVPSTKKLFSLKSQLERPLWCLSIHHGARFPPRTDGEDLSCSKSHVALPPQNNPFKSPLEDSPKRYVSSLGKLIVY